MYSLTVITGLLSIKHGVGVERIVKGLTDIGQMREENQDNFSWCKIDDTTYFLVVADGMGGYKGGAQASKLVVENIIKHIQSLEPSKIKANPQICISDAIKEGNRQVNNEARRNPELKNMGSTCVCALIIDDLLYTAHIGDSRAYILRNGVIRQLTEDHTVVQELVRAGYVHAEDAPYHPSAGILTQCLGQMDTPKPEFYPPFTLIEGDRVLLCSDGLSGMLDDDEIAEVVFHETMDDAPEVLISLANDAGGFDNITLLIYAHGKIEGDIKSIPISVGPPVFMKYIEPDEVETTSPYDKLQNLSTGHSSGYVLEGKEKLSIPVWLSGFIIGFTLFLIFFVWYFEVV